VEIAGVVEPHENFVVTWSVETRYIAADMDVCWKTTGPLHRMTMTPPLIISGLTDSMAKRHTKKESRWWMHTMSKQHSCRGSTLVSLLLALEASDPTKT
jgi:hypothetical protein